MAKAWDVLGYAHAGEILCLECAPAAWKTGELIEDVAPVFQITEGAFDETCGQCLQNIAAVAGY